MNLNERLTLAVLQSLYLADEIIEFQRLLDEYDWHYFQSDNQKTYLKGQYQFEKIKEMIKHNITFYFMYMVRADEVYNK